MAKISISDRNIETLNCAALEEIDSLGVPAGAASVGAVRSAKNADPSMGAPVDGAELARMHVCRRARPGRARAHSRQRGEQRPTLHVAAGRDPIPRVPCAAGRCDNANKSCASALHLCLSLRRLLRLSLLRTRIVPGLVQRQMVAVRFHSDAASKAWAWTVTGVSNALPSAHHGCFAQF